MPPDDIREIERKLDRVMNELEHTTSALKALHRRLDEYQASQIEMDKQLLLISREQAEHKAKHSVSDGWVNSRLGSIVDKLLPALLMVAVMYLMKGGLK